MKNIFFRICKNCNNILKFKEKNKIEVLPCFCKTCRKNKKMQDTNDLFSFETFKKGYNHDTNANDKNKYQWR